jgi:hypothetical protein
MTRQGRPWRGALSGRSGSTGWLAVGSERQPTVRGGGPRSGDARGGRLVAARSAAAGAEVCGATMWRHGRARNGAPRQLQEGV